MEAGPVIEAILMEASAIFVLAVLVAFAVWVSRTEQKTAVEPVETVRSR